MFQKKKLKNPISVIRKPEEINKEYSDLVIKLGQFEIEKFAIDENHEKQASRMSEISDKRLEIIDRIKELTTEMNEAQAELAKKQQPVSAPQAAAPEARL